MQITRALRRHVALPELLDRTDACPVCGATRRRGRVFQLQADPDVYMLSCPVCRGCSASHMPAPAVLADYYAHYYDDREHAVTFSGAARFARHLVKTIPGGAFGSSVSILDYGGGDGSLAKAIAERLIAVRRIQSADIHVIDVVRHEYAGDDRIKMRHGSPSEPIVRRYDLVLASAILEHVPDLHPLLKTLYGSIAEDGFFYARTPYVIPLTRLFPSLDLTYPAHVHDMGSDFWNRFSDTFQWCTRVVTSRPSVVAGTLVADPLRTISAAVLKAPAHVENWLSPSSRADRLWHLVGGWEILLQKNEARQRRAS
jgi:SAM-dependent methyltransferase